MFGLVYFGVLVSFVVSLVCVFGFLEVKVVENVRFFFGVM